MAFFSESLALPENAFTILRDLIMERTGIYYEESKKDILADKLSNRVLERGFSSFIDYYYLLKYDNDSQDEWNVVFDLIAVRETYFWREYDQIDALVNHIIPRYAADNPGRTLRIWCAACSTGEEPLSILIALDSAGWMQKIKIELTASDASLQALEKAQKGLYRERSFRSLPTELRDRYFTRSGEEWKIKPAIHKMVKWRRMNLMKVEELTFITDQDVIFCRNVFIYFREEAIRKTAENLFARLRSPGFLFLGSAESLLRINTSFELTEIGETFVYMKA
jgi:chemotaxis protein methyltransferase CheR